MTTERKSVLAPADDPEVIDLATILVIGLETDFLNDLIAKAEVPNRCGCHQCQLKVDEKINIAWEENRRLNPCGKQDEEELIARSWLKIVDPPAVKFKKRKHRRRSSHWEDEE